MREAQNTHKFRLWSPRNFIYDKSDRSTSSRLQNLGQICEFRSWSTKSFQSEIATHLSESSVMFEASVISQTPSELWRNRLNVPPL